MKTKFCIWNSEYFCFEFDAKNQNDELSKIQKFAKENNIKITDMKKER